MKLPLATGFLSRAPAAVGGIRGDSGRFRVPDDRTREAADATTGAATPLEILMLDDIPMLDADALVVADLTPPPPPITSLSP